MKEELLEVLVCPDCDRYPLEVQNVVFQSGEIDVGQIVCPHCGSKFDIIQGIPVLLPTVLQMTAANAGVKTGQLAEQHKRTQIDYFNNVGTSEFEITRPHNTGRLYQALLNYKVKQSLRLISADLNKTTILCVCCGSGMDLEHLYVRGGRVVGLDISLGAVIGAKERARRFNLEYDLVVGDAEHLPIRTDSFDFGYVHDGLHHLALPFAGLRELWRVSRQAVILTEPTEAFLTKISILLGISGVVEEAGNKVRRLPMSEIEAVLTTLMPTSVAVKRYLMWYPHEPPQWFTSFDRNWLFNTYWFIFGLLNHIVGQWGNKLTVTIWKNGKDAGDK